MLCGAALQFGVIRLELCCKEKPVEGDGQEMTTVFVAVKRIASNGAPGICTGTTFQNPPDREYVSPVIISPASAWPIVPLIEYTPPVLVPPPPAMVCQSME